MLELGTEAPAFSLPDVTSDQTFALEDFGEKKALLVIFLCAHCPYVVHVAAELARLGQDYAGQGVGLVGISSNDIQNYPEDAPRGLAAFAKRAGIDFPVLFDETQEVALAYTAACTPDLFLFDQDRRLVYRGQLDSSRPGKGKADGRDVRDALDSLLAGKPIDENQLPSTGCNIKWKAGNAPNS